MASWHVPGYVPKTTGKVSKVVVLGQKGCGKTSILEQLLFGNILEIYPTIEDTYVANIENDRGVRERIRFLDTGGLEPKAREFPHHYLGIVDGIILVYAINDADSFTTIDYIKKDIDRNREKKELPIVVLANKKDMESSRVVEQSIAQVWANREKVKLFEVTSTNRSCLFEPFVYLSSKVNLPPSKSFSSILACMLAYFRFRNSIFFCYQYLNIEINFIFALWSVT